MKSQKIIIGNFKQNPDTLDRSIKLAGEYIKLQKKYKDTTMGIALPSVFLHEVNKKYGKNLNIYSQTVSEYLEGSHTGEISVNQINSIGIKKTLVGHSERRAMGDTNEIVQKQILNALNKKMQVILCVGEPNRENNNEYIKFVDTQIETALDFVKKIDYKNITVAYEPVWAIGSNAKRSANVNEIYEMTIAIRKKLIEIFGKTNGTQISILYGGSVNSKNAEEIMDVHHINGFLLGRASLDIKEVTKIIEIINK